jgi:HK97 gp10 family phage protein
VTVKTEGFKELDEILGTLGKSMGRNVLRRTAKTVLEPVADRMRSLVAVDEGDLKASITVSQKLTTRQKRMAKKETKSFVEMYAGPGGLKQATTLEFGTNDTAAQPYARPAWDEAKPTILDTVKDELAIELDKAVVRKARKAARMARA